MKLSKLMLGMAVAATTLAACNKEDITPVVEQGNKSVTLNIANLLQTKGTGTEVVEGTAVQLNSVQVFFADAAGTLYAPKSVDAKDTVATYFEGAQAKVSSHQFHFLPKAVSKVIVLGNMPYQDVKEKNLTYNSLLDAVKTLTVGDEQDPEDLRLFGIDETLAPAGNHAEAVQDKIQHPDPFVKAEVNLVPTVARFEVTGFEYAQVAVAAGQTAPARNYTEMVVNSLSMRNWYTTATATFAGAVTPATLDPFAITDLDKDNIYGTYFSKVTAGWYYDATAHTLNAANNYVETVATVTVKDDKPVSDNKCYDYHVFPGAVPQFLIELTGKENGVNSPLFLMTSALKVGDKVLAAKVPEGDNTKVAIEAGKVYRMAMRFDDNNLQAPEKCVEVAITVDDWNVVVVTPEF